ncbi:hypothetical protein [Streptomyces sp. NPDC004250]|uniref:hypothetical protein n=1 Tax=Streptomyces sp. NPDC004250 TaxID=3364692 RepID=UPI0036815CC6
MIALPSEKQAAERSSGCGLARRLLALTERVKDNDQEFRETFRLTTVPELLPQEARRA